MKVTFVSPYYHNIWESLGIGYIAAVLNDVDLQFLHGNFDVDILNKCLDSDIVAFSCTTPTFSNGLSLARKIKDINPDIHIVFGGWHVTAIGENRWDEIDSIVVGEGEYIFRDIVNGLRGKVIYGYHSPFGNLPWPDRKIINQDRTLTLCENICGERIASFQSRRGCPMNCKMCAESCMTGQVSVRVRDPEDLLEEIKFVDKTYDITKFKFLDPTWCYPKKAVYDFCDLKIKSNVKIKWEGMAHAGFIDKDMMKLMKESGCDQINIGVESGSQKILNSINKGVTVNKIKKVFKWGHELNINMRAFFILGTPEEDAQSIRDTELLAEEIDPDVFGMTLLCPYPGSEYYDDIKYKDVDWSKADEYSNYFWKTKNFTNQQLRDIQKKFTDKFVDKLNWHQRINI